MYVILEFCQKLLAVIGLYRLYRRFLPFLRRKKKSPPGAVQRLLLVILSFVFPCKQRISLFLPFHLLYFFCNVGHRPRRLAHPSRNPNKLYLVYRRFARRLRRPRKRYGEVGISPPRLSSVTARTLIRYSPSPLSPDSEWELAVTVNSWPLILTT